MRLKGAGYEMEFWRQTEVVRDLESSLQASLQASGHRVVECAKKTAPVPAAPVLPEPEPEPSKAKKGRFFRRSSNRKAEEVPEPSLAPPLSSPGSLYQVVVPEEPLREGEVRVKVGVSEVVVRTVSDMGLYGTKAGKAVVVGLEIGG